MHCSGSIVASEDLYIVDCNVGPSNCKSGGVATGKVFMHDGTGMSSIQGAKNWPLVHFGVLYVSFRSLSCCSRATLQTTSNQDSGFIFPVFPLGGVWAMPEFGSVMNLPVGAWFRYWPEVSWSDSGLSSATILPSCGKTCYQKGKKRSFLSCYKLLKNKARRNPLRL